MLYGGWGFMRASDDGRSTFPELTKRMDDLYGPVAPQVFCRTSAVSSWSQ